MCFKASQWLKTLKTGYRERAWVKPQSNQSEFAFLSLPAPPAFLSGRSTSGCCALHLPKIITPTARNPLNLSLVRGTVLNISSKTKSLSYWERRGWMEILAWQRTLRPRGCRTKSLSWKWWESRGDHLQGGELRLWRCKATLLRWEKMTPRVRLRRGICVGEQVFVQLTNVTE